MHLIDDVYLEPGTGRQILGIIQYLTHIIDAGIGSRVEFDQIDKTTAVYFQAGAAFTARCGSDAGRTIQRLGKDSRNGGFADTARAGEQVSMMQSILRERIAQGTNDMLLPRQLSESLGSPFSCKYCCG